MTPEQVRALIVAALNAQGVPVLDSPEADPPKDPSGRVRAYAVVYMGWGWRDPEETSACGARDLAVWEWTVMACAGTAVYADWCVKRVVAALEGVELGGGMGAAWSTPGPQAISPDRTFTPTRWFLPLNFAAQHP